MKGQVECEAFVNTSTYKDRCAVMKAKRLYTGETCVVVCDGRIVFDPCVSLGNILGTSPMDGKPEVEQPKTTKGGKRGRKN